MGLIGSKQLPQGSSPISEDSSLPEIPSPNVLLLQQEQQQEQQQPDIPPQQTSNAPAGEESLVQIAPEEVPRPKTAGRNITFVMGKTAGMPVSYSINFRLIRKAFKGKAVESVAQEVVSDPTKEVETQEVETQEVETEPATFEKLRSDDS